MKNSILIIIIIILACVAVFAAFQIKTLGIKKQEPFKKNQKQIKQPKDLLEQSKENNQNNQNKKSAPVKESIKEKQQSKSGRETESQLKIQARAFIQIYGSYSSDSGYANLISLLDFMSDKLRKAEQKRIKAGIDNSQGFFSKIVKINTIKTISFIKDSNALFSAQVQVKQTKNNKTKVSRQTVGISFIKFKNKWLVDSINFK